MASQLSILESTLSARTSSWKTSLQTLKQKTSGFLATHHQASPTTAIEAWTLEKEALEEQKEQCKTEAEALRDGIVMWEDVLALVKEFEKSLKSQLSSSSPSQATKETLLRGIEDIIEKLDQRLTVAEERNWKLLVCSIGTELQAFKEAREMMRQSLGLPLSNSSSVTAAQAPSPDPEDSRKNITQMGGSSEMEAETDSGRRARPGTEEPEGDTFTTTNVIGERVRDLNIGNRDKLLLVDYSPLDD